MNTVSRTLGLLAALAFCLNSAFASTTEAATTSDASGQDSATVSPPIAEPAAGLNEKPATPKFGAGMQIPVDGTSLDAFDKSLADIKTKTTKPEYTTLSNAIDFLMVYYIDARRDRTKLAALLNGMTGEQIVAMVKW